MESLDLNWGSVITSRNVASFSTLQKSRLSRAFEKDLSSREDGGAVSGENTMVYS